MNESTANPALIDPSMKEIVESFLVETKEILEKLDVDLLELEKRPEDSALLNQVFRSFHTIKGTSGFLGLEKLPHITHACEDILNKLRKKEVVLNSELMEGITLGYDTIKVLIQVIETQQNEDVDTNEVDGVLQRLVLSIQSGIDANADRKIEKNEKKEEGNNSAVIEREDSVKDKTVLVHTDDEVKAPKQEAASKATSNAQQKDNTIRVDVDRLDSLLNIVSELVLGRNRLTQINTKFSIENEGTKYSRDFGEVTKQIDLMTTELQLVSMKLRMIKIGKIFNRFPRLVRDVSRDLNKDVELIIKGEETEVDKNLIEEINDPLVHLIRNSVDHGVEKPDVREKAGKSRKGTVVLSAEHAGNNIIITIEDDGKGIDPEVIRSKAVSKGLISKEKAKELSKQEVINLIFLPGFSSAEVVSNVSGRGVGMDVVKTNVVKLRGIIDIESEAGKGTKIVIKLPLTLAIISGMIVNINTETMVVPLSSVIEVLRVNSKQIRFVNGKEVIQLRDSVLPLIDLEQLIKLGGNGKKKGKSEWQYVVEIGIAEKKFGVKVDGLVGQQEVVIKSLGSYLGKINGVAGSTIMGDGSVVMILDVHELFNKREVYA